VDCEINTLNVSVKNLTDALNTQPNMRAFFLTHTLGFSDDVKNISELCEKKNIILLEDVCEALGSVVLEKKLGNFGLGSTFSFFVGHHISTIEGGMICTDDEDLYHNLLTARSHGWDRHHPPEAQKKLRKMHGVDDFFAKYTFYDLGYNVRPSEINGFLGNDQLQYWDEIVRVREENFNRLHKKIKQNPDLVSLEVGHMDLISNFAIPIIVKEEKFLEIYKNKFISNNVEIRPMIAGNMARQPFFRKYISNPGFQKNADFIHSHSLYFGNNPELSEEELKLLETIIVEEK
jgi:CDP-6-deoxy-D-xylo-4-hexulose-3-dehydrase